MEEGMQLIDENGKEKHPYESDLPYQIQGDGCIQWKLTIYIFYCSCCFVYMREEDNNDYTFPGLLQTSQIQIDTFAPDGSSLVPES
uniref:Uncharacterized protein n=1 Tax=Salix viminalis TaxID=40686 RepID=A0A6N2LSI9_SALVM